LVHVPASLGQIDDTFQINPGLSGAWFNPDTVGQGFFVDVLPDTDLVFMSWFTYDTAPPGDRGQHGGTRGIPDPRRPVR
jgi:hypothetical protein